MIWELGKSYTCFCIQRYIILKIWDAGKCIIQIHCCYIMIYFLKIKQCDCTDNGKVLSWTVVTKSYNLHGQQHIPMTCLDATILYDQWLPGTSVPVLYKVLTGTCRLGKGICNSLSSTHPCMVFLLQRLNSGSLVNPADAKKWIPTLTVSWQLTQYMWLCSQLYICIQY